MTVRMGLASRFGIRGSGEFGEVEESNRLARAASIVATSFGFWSSPEWISAGQPRSMILGEVIRRQKPFHLGLHQHRA